MAQKAGTWSSSKRKRIVWCARPGVASEPVRSTGCDDGSTERESYVLRQSCSRELHSVDDGSTSVGPPSSAKPATQLAAPQLTTITPSELKEELIAAARPAPGSAVAHSPPQKNRNNGF